MPSRIKGMSASNSGSGKSRRGRGVTRVADVTSGRVDGQRRHVDIDPRSSHPSGPHADRFRSYLGKLAKSHVSILHACWDDVPEVDKNLLWQDIQQHFDISNTMQIRKKVLSHIAIRWRDFKTRLTRLYVFGDRQHENLCQQYTFTEEDWMQFRASREFEEWNFGSTQKTPQSMSQETLRQMDLQWEERLNQSMRSMEQRFIEQLQEQKQIQRALEEKLHSMTQGNMGADDTPTPPRVNTRGSCSAVEPSHYSGQYELLIDGDPPRIVAIGRVLEGGETIHGVAILPQHVRFTRPQKQPIHDTVIHEDDYMAEAEDDPLSKLMTKLPRVIGKSRGQLVQILYPKCNQQIDSWECGFYVMCWIKTIIRAVITDD
ncbi:uncharacterized protein HKW66_Vig0200920 [Vigna angularis]|uniref:Ubiquitin-like protease family profile domain-containing protein n=1 Tax=Phaseolus angularis TaxID=3914 RepID=A0A8T0JRZ7_PHAAN|nr:uncharacterized protein HKW66_Vig0200920 [Vigna angularis]